MRIFSSMKIGFDNQFLLECKGCLIAFKDQFWMMRVILISDNNVVLWKVSCNCQSQDVLNFHAKVVASSYIIEDVERSDGLVDTNDGLQ